MGSLEELVEDPEVSMDKPLKNISTVQQYKYIYILYVFYNIYIICCEFLPYVTISGLWIQNTVNCELLAEHQKWIRLTHDWTCLVFSRFLCLERCLERHSSSEP